MPTFSRTPFDPAKPETAPAIPTTADQRAQHAAGNTAFSAAHDDVAALETGKEDAGTAADEVAAHDASAAAHGNVEANLASHTSGQVNAHTAIDSHIASTANPHGVTAAQTGALEDVFTADGDIITRQAGATAKVAIGSEGQVFKVSSGLPAWEDESVGSAGVEVRKDNAGGIPDATILDFEDTGDATVSIFDAGSGRVRISIDATAGSGGGGVGKGTPFVAGELTEVSSSGGAGEIRTVTGLTSSSVTGHLADTDIHFPADSLPGAGLTEAGGALQVGAGTAITVDSTSVNVDEASITHNNIGGRTAAAAHPTSAITGLDAALASKLENVIEDMTPQLGGELQSKGQAIALTRSDDSYHALIGAMTTEEGGYFVYSADGTTFDPADGGITVEPGKVHTYGQQVIEILKHSNPAGQDLKVTPEGVVIGVDPPPAGWSDNDTDTGFYSRSGVGLNVWQQITGLQLTVAEDITLGDEVDIGAGVYTRNTTSNRTGTVAVGFGVNGAQPTTDGQSYNIVENFAGFLNLGIKTFNVAASSGDTVEVWVRVTAQSNSQFSTGLQFDGGAGNDHEAYIGVPSSGGGGSGDMISPSAAVAVGELYEAANIAGTQTAGTGFLASDVARKSVDNGFTANQTVASATGVAAVAIKSSDLNSLLLLQPGNGTPEQRAFAFQVNAGSYDLLRVDDTGGVGSTPECLQVNWSSQNVDVPNGELREQGNRVTHSAQEGGVGDLIQNVLKVTAAEYAGLTPDATTLYLIE